MKGLISKYRQNVSQPYKPRGILTLSGTLAALLLLPVIIFISNQAQSQRTSNAQEKPSKQEMSKETLAALGLYTLNNDEFALIKQETGEATGKKTTYTIDTGNGQTISYDTDKLLSLNIIKGNDKATNYIKSTDGIDIRNNLVASQDQNYAKHKIDPVLVKKLKKNETVGVIIRLNVPYDKYYEDKQSNEKVKEKNTQFENAKNKVGSKLSSKSQLKRDLKIINGISADLDLESLSALESSADVKKVELDGEMKAFLDTSLDQIRVKDVWGLVSSGGQSLTGVGQKIAILDTGVDYTHPDFGGCLGATCKVIGGYDFINNDNNPMDDHGHGTHVAATAAGKGSLYGVAPDAKIIAVKVLNSGGSGSWSQVISGINYAADPNGDGNTSDRVDVASMSLGGSGNPDDAVSFAVDNAAAAGIVFTIAAGNSGPSSSTIQSPGTARNAITIAASCKTSQIGSSSYCAGPIASFSSRGPLVWNGVDLQKPDVSAPGVLICAARWGTSFGTAPTCFDSQHTRISGTSMATPHVAGVAALIRQAYPGYSPAQVKQLLKTTARNLGVSANDQGTGEVDAKAAIPISSKVSATPNNWSVISDPSNKISTHQQNFSIKSNDAAINSLTVTSTSSISGVLITPSKSELQVGNGGTDNFDATLSIDNDLVKPGNYNLLIYLSQNGENKGLITIFLTVKPTFTVSPLSIDYGIDDPSLSSWTSEIKTLSVKNLRLDSPQTITIASSTYPNGISYQSPASVNVPANSTNTVDTKFVVNNSEAANDIYTGTLTLSNTTGKVIVGTKFVKFYVLTIQDSTLPGLTKAWPVIVHNRAGNNYYDYTYNGTRVFYLNTPGTYDVIVRYSFHTDPATGVYSDAVVFKEGVSVSSGQTTLNVSRTEAKNLVKTVPTDSTGTTGSLSTRDEEFIYNPDPQLFTHLLRTIGGTSDILATEYFSNTSNSYTYNRKHQSPQPEQKIHYYFGTFTGIQGNISFTNTQDSFKKVNIQWDIDQQTGQLQPLIYDGNNGFYHVYYNNNVLLSLPLTQTVYSLVPGNNGQFFGRVPFTDGGGYLFKADMTPVFTTDETIKRTTFEGIILPGTNGERTLYAGMGPSFWQGIFKNTATKLRLEPYYGTGIFVNSNNPGFLRQDFATKGYNQTTFGYYKDGTSIYSGIIPAYPNGNTAVWDYYTNAGKYEFRTDFPYKNKGQDMLAKVRATFDTANADPNPPAIKRLYTYTNGVRSEIYDPSGVNKIEVEFDPVLGELSTVGISFSADGLNFQPLTVENNSAVYSAFLPSTGTGKIALNLLAKDAAGNELSYTFELPKGVSNVPPPPTTPTPTNNPTLTPQPTNTPIPTNTPAPTPLPTQIPNTPTPTFLPQPTNTLAPADPPPAVTITNPVNGASIRRNSALNITASASDNIAVKRVEFYVNNTLKCSDTSAPYSCKYRLGSGIGAAYTIQAKAFDSLGQTAIHTIRIVSTK